MPAVPRAVGMRRRSLLTGLGAGLATALAGCSADDPPGTAGSPGDAPTGTTPTDSTPTGPVRWTTPVDGAVADPLSTGATLAYVDGTGPAYDRWLFVPTEAGTLHALDPATGDHRWRADLGKPVRDVAVAADAGVVLAHAGTATLGDDHLVRAFDAGGTEQWTFPESAGANPWGPLGLLGADGKRALVASRDDQPASDGERLWALDATDGTDAWTGEVGDPQSAAVTDDAVFVASRRAVDAFARPGGERLWRYATNDAEYRFDTLRGRGRTAFFATEAGSASGTVHAIGPDGGHGWRRDRYTTGVTNADGLYLGGGPVTAVDPATGDTRWETASHSLLAGAPVADGRLFAGGDGVAAYDTASGGRLWQWSAEADIVVAQAATADAVYAATGGGSGAPNVLFARDTADGSERWIFRADAGLSDAALGEFVYVGDGLGTVHALDR